MSLSWAQFLAPHLHKEREDEDNTYNELSSLSPRAPFGSISSIQLALPCCHSLSDGFRLEMPVQRVPRGRGKGEGVTILS